MEGLQNMMEENVERAINQLLPTMPNICACNDLSWIWQHTLNRLHPKYTRTDAGASFIDLIRLLNR